jgi:UDP-N-acetylmuramoyl-tripeptide--D-alanyl-D-alanine ligase
MMAGTLSQAAESMQGTLHGENVAFRGVSTDTRSLQPGELFVALQGPNFDGTKFVRQAEERQAAAAVVPQAVETDLPIIVVDDTLAALGTLAASWRQQMPATVVGVTGSNGKTTLKERLASCLSISDPTLATHGNLNNEIGMPLMLLRMGENHRYAVIEMGANHPGEIAYLTSLASPRVVAITNAAPAHLEGFGSVDGVAKAKGEIITSDHRPECVILNADDDYFEYWSSLVGDAELISFGLSAEANVRASGIEAVEGGSTFTMHMPESQFPVTLALQGKHNVLNACAAAAIARSLSITDHQIKRGLEAVQPFHGRLQPVRSSSGAVLFDDSYNANPVSVQAAADFLATQKGATWLVLGDMAELGGDGALLHGHTGWVVRESGVDNLLATGPLSKNTVDAFGENGRWYQCIDDLVDDLRNTVAEGDVVLVKGSLSMGMERVVEAMTETLDKAGSA